MNRRLMMQQQKGFELVYDAAGGELPKSSDGWNFTLNGNTTATVENGYLRISGDGSHLSPRAEFTINKPQNLNKSRSITIRLGDMLESSVNIRLTDEAYYLEKYPEELTIVFKVWGQWLYYKHNKTTYQTLSIIYDAVTNLTSFYLEDVLLYSSNNGVPQNFKFVTAGKNYVDIASITYKEW